MGKSFFIKRFAFFFTEKVVKYCKPALKTFEESRKKLYIRMGEKHQPVFIVGAPRTGSTILYQILTNNFDVLYIDNLICLFNSSFYFGFSLSNKIFKDRPHNCFVSVHGRTLHKGLRAPSECGQFWYRWLPTDRHYIREGQVPKRHIEEIREDIFSVINRYDKPIIFKNMNMGQRMWLLSKVAPRAKIIFVKRNPLYVAQSILNVRKRIGKNPNYWWSIMPKNYNQLLSMDYHEQIVKQIYFIEKQIYEDSRFFPDENFIDINYEDLCLDVNKTLSKILRFIGGSIKKRKNAEPPILDFSEKQSVRNDDMNKFRNVISKLDWQHYRT